MLQLGEHQQSFEKYFTVGKKVIVTVTKLGKRVSVGSGWRIASVQTPRRRKSGWL